MKNFDDFVKFINESDKVQKELADIPLNLKDKIYDLSSSDDISDFKHSLQEQTLNQFMKILREYHNWTNQN